MQTLARKHDILLRRLCQGACCAGQLGLGIAQVAATRGFEVTLHDSSTGALQRALKAISGSLDRLVCQFQGPQTVTPICW
jgi:3-hydroxyacyl-CoA dehydrogenase